MAMKDVATAADLRAVIEKIVKKVIEKERPAVRQGRVFSFNTETNVAMVLFPGNTIEGLVPVTFGKNMIPSVAMIDTFDTDGYNAAGDVVRVAGKPNDWYVVGFSVGLPVSEHTQLNSIKGAYEDNLVLTGPGTARIYLTYLPSEHSEHLYWNGVYQNKDQWTRDGTVVTVTDPDFLFRTGDELVMEYLYVDDATRPIIEASMSFIGYTIGPHGDVTSLDLPAGTLEGDLLVMGLVSKVGASCTDPRIGVQFTTGHKVAGYGYATADTSPIDVYVEGDFINGTSCILAAYRITGQVETVFQGDTSMTGTTYPATFSPPEPTDCDMGITIIMAGIVGTVPRAIGNAEQTGQWTYDVSGGWTYEDTWIGHCFTGTPVGQWQGTSGGDWASLAIGLKAL